VHPFTDKIVLEERAEHPLCPWCESPVSRVHWHRIRGGPMALHYVVVLSCAACRAALDILEGGGGGDAAVM
jgi:hypothetical protein